VVGLWRERAEDVRGVPFPGGHYLPEELQSEVARHLGDFFSAG
jgi:hypothetical protein